MSRISPTVRGFLIILAIAAVITVLQLQITLISLLLLARIAFFIAIAVFLFLMWRERRQEIATWSLRSRVVFYGAAGLALVNLGALSVTAYPTGGLEALIFFFVFGACGFAMWRVWRDEHTYGY
jgi:hypothetical protein